MRTENAAIRVHFVDYHQAETLEKWLPDGVVGKNTLVEHIRVGQQEN